MNAHQLAVIGVILVASACTATTQDHPVAVSGSSQALRALTPEESLADFDQMVTAFRAEYGPMARKEERYHFSFEQHAQDSRKALEKAHTDIERETVIAQFIARFHDSHVALQDQLSSEEPPILTLPLSVMPLGDGYVVYWVDPKQTIPITRGDELLAIDGTPVADIIEGYAPLVGRANALSKRHSLAQKLTSRFGVFLGELSAGDQTSLQLRDASGDTHEVSLTWSETHTVLADAPQAPAAGSGDPLLAYGFDDAQAIRAELRSYGEFLPFFYTKEVQTQFALGPVLSPSARALQDFGVPQAAANEIGYFATTYKYADKRILFLRLESFRTSTNANAAQRLNYLRALLSEQEPLNDALVLDLTHNPGGDGTIAQGLASMFASERADGIVSRMHVDRAQIAGYLQAAARLRKMTGATATELNEAAQLEAAARKLDELYSAGQALSEPIQVPDVSPQLEPDRVRWLKPRIVLIDELSTSAADVVPLLMKVNKLAPLFGSRTGGAGGNVEVVTTLPNSARELYLTRGTLAVFDPTGAYPDDRFVEDDGAAPDIEYNHTLEDFRAGYVGYFEAFSKALLDSATP